MFKILVYILFPICLFSNDFIWEKTEIGNDLINTDKIQLASSDSVGNVVLFDQELNTLFFKSNLDTNWQIRHKNEINSEISEVLSVFVSRGNIYLLVLYQNLTQSLISTEINNNLLSDIYTKYESFEFVSDSLIKLNKMVRLNDEILISYSKKVNMTDYFILHNFEEKSYKYKKITSGLENERNLIEGNKIIDYFFRKSIISHRGFDFDLIFLNKYSTSFFPIPKLNSNFDFISYGYLLFGFNEFGAFLNNDSLLIEDNLYQIKIDYVFEEVYFKRKEYNIFNTDTIFLSDKQGLLNLNGSRLIIKVNSKMMDGRDYNKITLILDDKGEVLTDFIKFNNTIFFLYYNEVDDLVYTYFSNDECDTWNFFISSNIEYTGEFENIVGKDEVYLYNDDAIYSTNYNYYFSSAEKFSNINHFYSGNIVKIFSNYNIEEIKIFDLNGKEVYTNFNVNTKTQEINLEEIGHTIGVYFCLVKTKNEIKVIKLIKGI